MSSCNVESLVTRIGIAVFGAVVLALPATAPAHHSPAVFDRSREITLTGVVTEFRWGNPHSWIHLDVENDEGSADNWSVEMDPASHLARRGWRSSTLKSGDRIEVTVHPLRNDEKGGQYIAVKLPDGKVMSDQGTPQVLPPER